LKTPQLPFSFFYNDRTQQWPELAAACKDWLSVSAAFYYQTVPEQVNFQLRIQVDSYQPFVTNVSPQGYVYGTLFMKIGQDLHRHNFLCPLLPPSDEAVCHGCMQPRLAGATAKYDIERHCTNLEKWRSTRSESGGYHSFAEAAGPVWPYFEAPLHSIRDGGRRNRYKAQRHREFHLCAFVVHRSIFVIRSAHLFGWMLIVDCFFRTSVA
jgi:hypothetical protein